MYAVQYMNGKNAEMLFVNADSFLFDSKLNTVNFYDSANEIIAVFKLEHIIQFSKSRFTLM